MKIGNLEVYGVIYKVTNIINNKVYIGQTITGFDKRYPAKGENSIKIYNYYKSRKNIASCNIHLLNSIEKYSVDAFEVNKIFDIAFSKEELNIKEKCWINNYNSNNYNYGYNNRDGGSNGALSEKTKEKIKNKKIGKKLRESNPNWKGGVVECKCNFCGEIIKLKQCEYKKRKKHYCSKECKSKYQTGQIMPEETKYKISDALSSKELYGGNNPNSKKVICITTGKIFDSIIEASKYYNIPSRGGITACCRGIQASCGKYNGQKLVWEYL